VFVSVAVWWLLLALPVLGTRAASSPVPTTTTPAAPASLWKACTAAVRQLRSTFSQIRQHKAAFAVLLAYMFYNTGVGAVITIATLFGKAELNLPTGTLVGCVLMIQFIGVPAALAFIRLGAWIGTRGAILSGLGVYALTLLLAFRMTTAAEFWLLGVLVGLVQGGTQALSRSLYGRLIPTERSAEFFGFFSVFSKVGGFAGPLLYGLVRDATGSSRLGVLSLLVFFVAGGLVLWAAPLGRAQDSPGSGKAGGG
jgi:UMF1 family MFS transporter